MRAAAVRLIFLSFSCMSLGVPQVLDLNCLVAQVEALSGTRDALGGDAGGQRGAFALARPGQAFSFEALARAGGPRVSAGALSALAGDVASVTAFMRTCVGA